MNEIPANVAAAIQAANEKRNQRDTLRAAEVDAANAANVANAAAALASANATAAQAEYVAAKEVLINTVNSAYPL